MNKRDLYRHILVLSASKVLMNVTCKNTFFTKVAVGWEGLLICTQERMNRREQDFKIAVLSRNNVRNIVTYSNMIFIKVKVGWDGFSICVKKNFKYE